MKETTNLKLWQVLTNLVLFCFQLVWEREDIGKVADLNFPVLNAGGLWDMEWKPHSPTSFRASCCVGLFWITQLGLL